jgi:5-hydroxyisourate hydrolase
MGTLTTHVLDTANGRPGSGISVKLFSMENGRHLVASAVTNVDGRTETALLDGETYRAGTYELEFSVADYFSDKGASPDAPPFLNDVIIRVTLAGDDQYHVPLLVSPWGYSTYRGS